VPQFLNEIYLAVKFFGRNISLSLIRNYTRVKSFALFDMRNGFRSIQLYLIG